MRGFDRVFSVSRKTVSRWLQNRGRARELSQMLIKRASDDPAATMLELGGL
jgi:hypothetical protein